METIFEQSGYADSLGKNGEKGQDAADNVRELINAAAAYDKSTETPSLLDWLQTIALYSDTDAYDENSPVVSLMTLHAAKGLEFDHAFIVGAEDGLLPHERSVGHGDDLEEERRLFFVGITRARDHLTISHAKHRMMHGQFLRTTPSQFLYEIGYSDGFQDDWPCRDDGLDNTTAGNTKYANNADNPNDGDGTSPRKKLAPFRVNELVRHDKFGLGHVKEFLDMGNDSIVVVNFNSGRTKSLMTRYAKLEKINT
jgi:DNA helicase-2/ATP-dependent DNA helicase PcrA